MLEIKTNFKSDKIKAVVDVVADVKKQDMFVPVCILVPYSRLASDINRELAARQLSLANVSVKTMYRLIADATELQLAIAGQREVSSYERLTMFRRLVTETEFAYFDKVQEFASLPGIFARTLNELLLHGEEKNINKALTELPGEKGRDIKKLLTAYRDGLTAENLVEYADRIKLFLKDKPTVDTQYILYPGLEFELGYLERQCIDTLQQTGLCRSAQVTPSKTSRQLSFRSAPYDTLEVSTILRDVVKLAEQGTLFEDIAVVCADRSYLNEFYRQCENAGIPAYLPDGITCYNRTADHVILALLKIMLEDFEFTTIRNYLLINNYFPMLEKDSPGSGRLLKTARENGVASDRKEWITKLEEALKNEDVKKYEVEPLQCLQQLIKHLAKWADRFEKAKTGSDLLDLTIELTDAMIWKGQQKNSLLAFLKALRSSGLEHDQDFAEYYEWLNDLLGRNVRAAGNSSGSLYVTVSRNIGVFEHVYTCGMSERKFPRVFRQDPVLLDPEREEIFNKKYGFTLPLSCKENQKELGRFIDLVSSAEKSWTGFYPALDIMSGSKRLPTSYIPDIYRAVTGKMFTAKGLAEFLEKIEKETGLFPQDSRDSLDLEEFRTGEALLKGKQSIDHLFNVYNNLSRSNEANRNRFRNKTFDHYFGIIDDDCSEQDTWYSATRLETFMSCPFRYYLKYVLKIKPIEEPSASDEIDIMKFGSMVHEIFEEYMVGKKKVPLDKITDKYVKQFLYDNPPTYDIYWQQKQVELDEIMETFADYEEHNEDTPYKFEWTFGKDGVAPAEIKVGNHTMLTAGSMDRVDKTEEGYKILDYKAGNAKYHHTGVLKGGRSLQPCFYAEVLRVLAGEPDAHIQSGYFALKNNINNEVHTHEYNDEMQETFTEIIDHIMRGISTGQFFPSANFCRLCDFTRVCGNKRVDWINQRKETDTSEQVQEHFRIADYE